MMLQFGLHSHRKNEIVGDQDGVGVTLGDVRPGELGIATADPRARRD